MQIISALFLEGIELREVAGPATHLDLTGVQFSAAASQQVPLTWSPHLCVIVGCDHHEPGTGALEVQFKRDGEQIARNVQPLAVEPGKFTYRLIRAELEFEQYGTVQAHCRIDLGDVTVVPFTLLEPVE